MMESGGGGGARRSDGDDDRAAHSLQQQRQQQQAGADTAVDEQPAAEANNNEHASEGRGGGDGASSWRSLDTLEGGGGADEDEGGGGDGADNSGGAADGDSDLGYDEDEDEDEDEYEEDDDDLALLEEAAGRADSFTELRREDAGARVGAVLARLLSAHNRLRVAAEEEDAGAAAGQATSLPAATRAAAAGHQYLGAGVAELPGGAFGWLEPGREYVLPLIALPGVVIAPGQALPLRVPALGAPRLRAAVALALRAPPPLRGLVFVAACAPARAAAGGQAPLADGGLRLLSPSGIGCTAEIRCLGASSGGGAVGGSAGAVGSGSATAALEAVLAGEGGAAVELSVVARGRQRAQMLGHDGEPTALVSFAEAPAGGNETAAVASPSLPASFGGSAAAATAAWRAAAAAARRVKVRAAPEARAALPREVRLLGAAVCPVEARGLDPDTLARHVRAAMRSVLLPAGAAADGDGGGDGDDGSGGGGGGLAPPADASPRDLADWLSANLPLPPAARQALLDAPHAAARLRLLLGALRRLSGVACARCGARIAAARDMMRTCGADGGGGGGGGSGGGGGGDCGGTFVNEHGYVHDLATFARLAPGASVRLVGRPDAGFSWFPGYAWQLAHCGRCGAHLGWRYVRTVAHSLAAHGGGGGVSAAAPSAFWGLRRPMLVAAAAGAATGAGDYGGVFESDAGSEGEGDGEGLFDNADLLY